MYLLHLKNDKNGGRREAGGMRLAAGGMRRAAHMKVESGK